MNSNLAEKVQGFLKRRSVLHSVECRLNSGVTPASSSSQFLIGVTSTPTVGPKLELFSVRLRSAAPPSSITATSFDSFSTDCASAFVQLRSKDTHSTYRRFFGPRPRILASRLASIVDSRFSCLIHRIVFSGHTAGNTGSTKDSY